MQDENTTIDLLITSGKKTIIFGHTDVLENLIKSLTLISLEEKIRFFHEVSIEAIKKDNRDTLELLLDKIQKLPENHSWHLIDDLMDFADETGKKEIKGIIEPFLNELILQLSVSTPDSAEIAIPDDQSTPPIYDEENNKIKSIFDPASLPNLLLEKCNKKPLISPNSKRKHEDEEKAEQSSPAPKQQKFAEKLLLERKNTSLSPDRKCG
jgi:hypothetical protein